jgi:hypothetical protein
MGHGKDPLSGVERGLRATRPHLDSDVEGRIVASVSRSGGRGRGARVFTVTLLSAGVLGAMSMFGGMSYASQVLGGTSTPSTPASDEYCPTVGEPDFNGDVHSNCHTGSKFRGAGGEDKPGAKG